MRLGTSLRLSSFIAGIALVLSLAGLGRTQGPVASKEDLTNAWKANAEHRGKLFAGEVKAGKDDKKHATVAAQWYLYRITIRSFDPVVVQREFNNDVIKLMDKKNEKTKVAFQNLFGQECVEAMKEVLRRDITADPTTVVQASQMLVTMGKLKQADVSNYLIELIEGSKTHDVVRLHALKAMKEMMPIRIQLDPVVGDAKLDVEDFKDAMQNARRKHDARNVDALAKFIERPIKMDSMSQDDLATLRFIRREAIVSLAAAGAPAVSAFNAGKIQKLDGLVAPTLMKVLIKGAISPPTTIQEKIEAALGLCAMEYPNMPEYQPEIAMNLVGRTLVEFTQEYNKDWGNFTLVGKGRVIPYVGFKADGRRLDAGLKQMVTSATFNLKNNPAGNAASEKAAKELQVKAKFLLDRVIAYEATDAGRLEDLNRFVAQSQPKNLHAFKTLKGPQIPLDGN